MIQPYFDSEGHLTDRALLALFTDEIEELARFELSEHLSYCDACLDRYTALLTEDRLLLPPQPVVAPVLRRLRSEGSVLQWKRILTAGIAACLALVFWFSGVFMPTTEIDPAHYSQAYHLSQQLTRRAQQFGFQCSDQFSQLFQRLSAFDLKGVSDYEKK